MDWLKIVLAQLGLLSGPSRLDSKQTSSLEKALEYVKTKTYDILYPKMKARTFIPVSNEVDPGAETITYYVWDQFGMAQIISNYADDLPSVAALAESYTAKVKGIGTSYPYTIQDLRRSAMAGTALTTRLASAARLYVESTIDTIAAVGDTIHGLIGLAKHPNVTLTSPTTGGWATATGLQMVADVRDLINAVVTACNEALEPDTVVMDSSKMTLLSTTRISTTGDSDTTALDAVKKNHPEIKNWEVWNKLKAADATDTGSRIVCYAKDPQVLSLEIPQEFEQLPPQAKNLAFIVPCHARCAGVLVYYPVAMGYMDGC
jgi:hypothetical protein